MTPKVLGALIILIALNVLFFVMLVAVHMFGPELVQFVFNLVYVVFATIAIHDSEKKKAP